MLCNHKGEILLMFSKHVGSKESNEAEVVAMLEALRIFSGSFQGKLIVKSNSVNVMAWVSQHGANSWRLQFHLHEIKAFSSCLDVVFPS